jgi:hypothetical protein
MLLTFLSSQRILFPLLGFSRNNRQAQTGLPEGYSLEEKTSKGKGMLYLKVAQRNQETKKLRI